MISFKGYLLIPGRLAEARNFLLSNIQLLNKPYILEKHINFQYNPILFYMEALQEYVKFDYENGYSIFNEKIIVSSKGQNSISYSFADMIQKIIQNLGETFVEAFLNCGAGKKPAAPFSLVETNLPNFNREGINSENVGLLRSCLRFLQDSYKKRVYPYHKIEISKAGKGISYKKWGKLIDTNFEKLFWIPNQPQDWIQYNINPLLIKKLGIYKDGFSIYGKDSIDYQFTPNYLIAMAVSPEIFEPEHARIALAMIDKHLLVFDNINF